jgi:hypothetical protein
VLAAAALGARSFADPAGDNNAAPDISSVTISESPEAVLTIEVAIANYQALPTDSWLNLWIDVDNNPRTGDDGDEALIRYLDDGGLQLYRWVRSEFQRQPTTGMTGTFAEGKLTLAVPKVALDGTSNFGLIVFTSRGQEDPDGEELIASDYAPGSGRIVYGSPGPVTVSDPVGDHEAAPDVTQVDVSDTKSGVITFAVTTPSHARITGDDWLELDVDIDRRRSTGGGGAEAVVGIDGGEPYVGRWSADEEDFVAARGSGVQVRSAGGVTTFTVPRRFLDDVASFDFYLMSGDWDPENEEDDALDFAPDGDAWWKYVLANKPPLSLIAGEPRGVPARPVAGKSFTVTVPVRRSDTARGVTSGSVACDFTVSGKRVRVSGRVASGIARCSLSVPSGASGSTLRGSMLVRSSGKSVKTGFAFRVR